MRFCTAALYLLSLSIIPIDAKDAVAKPDPVAQLPLTATSLPELHSIDEPMDEIGTLIVGGVKADPGEFKFMTSWHANFDRKPSCGASLVAPNLVLSAAHCAGVSGGVRIGSISANGLYGGADGPPGVERSIAEKIVHPQYDNNALLNDFMLLQLDQDVDTETYPPIELNFDPQEPADEDMLTVIGFGTISSGGSQPNELLKVDVPTVSHGTCSSQYSGLDEDVHLCAGLAEGGADSCQGDSGGPIFKEIDGERKQVGVVSFGQGCALPGYSGVYARVSGAEEWLTTEICSRSSAPKPSYCGPTPPPTPAPPTPAPTPCSTSTVVIEVTTDNYPAETGWTLTNGCTDEEPRSRSSFPNAGTTYIDEECIGSNAEYTFTITDSYSDGICCSYGSGSYKVTYDGTMVKEGAEFGGSESVNFGSCSLTPSVAPSVTQTLSNEPTVSPIAPVAPISPVSSPITSPNSPVEDCIECSDEGSPWMVDNNRVCGTNQNQLATKCNLSNWWRNNKYCQLSCFKVDNGYDGDNCCVPPCTECSDEGTPWMVDNNRVCGANQSQLATKCNLKDWWRNNKYCQNSCFIFGNGYDGDECCTDTTE